MTPDPPSPVPDEPLAEVGREPLREAIASARDERRGGISVGTLGVAAAASAAASYTASHVWGSGTVLSAALTPVIVALVSEFLRRPVDRVAATAQRVAPIVPRTPPGAAGAPDRRPLAPAREETEVGPGDWSTVTYQTTPSPGWRPRWRLVLATGLLAFVIVVAVFTVPDLLVGHSITGAGGSTTFWGGGAQNTPPVPTPTVSTPTTTQTVTVPTTTVTAPATVTVTTAVPPASTAPTTSTPTTTTRRPRRRRPRPARPLRRRPER